MRLSAQGQTILTLRDWSKGRTVATLETAEHTTRQHEQKGRIQVDTLDLD